MIERAGHAFRFASAQHASHEGALESKALCRTFDDQDVKNNEMRWKSSVVHHIKHSKARHSKLQKERVIDAL